jgi:hypothetical protein
MGHPSSAPGWYPDPSGAPGKRYFDGQQWSEHRAAAHKSASKAWIWAVVIAAVVVAIGVSVLTSMSSKVAQENAGDGHTPGTGGQSNVVQAAGLNQPVRDGKFEFVVTDASVPQHWVGSPQPRGQWFIATMTVTNTGNEPQSFFAQNQKLIDSAGRTYAADSMAAMAMNPTDTTMVMDMNPGFSITVKVPFDVPSGTPVSAVEVHDSAFSGGARITVG